MQQLFGTAGVLAIDATAVLAAAGVLLLPLSVAALFALFSSAVKLDSHLALLF